MGWYLQYRISRSITHPYWQDAELPLKIDDFSKREDALKEANEEIKIIKEKGYFLEQVYLIWKEEIK